MRKQLAKIELGLGAILISFGLVSTLLVTGIMLNPSYMSKLSKVISKGSFEESLAGNEDLLVGSEYDFGFFSNEILVKFDKETAKKVKNDGTSVGVDSVDGVMRRNNIKSISKLVKKVNDGDSDDVFDWVRVEFNKEASKISGYYKKDQNKIVINENGKEPLDMEKLKSEANEYENLINDLSKDKHVIDVTPNYLVTLNQENDNNDSVVSPLLAPNDPYFLSSGTWGNQYQDLWGIHAINAGSAWNTSTGTSGTIVAVIDSGVDRIHPDLASNMWINLNDDYGDNIDDDGNGYVDDNLGWDFTECERFYNTGVCAEPKNPDYDPMDTNGHGTHCAGTIGAVGNNGMGVVGVNWNVKIMSLRTFNRTGGSLYSWIIPAIVYATNNGARVISNSWGGVNPLDSAIKDAFDYAYNRDIVIVAASGNNSGDALNYSPASLSHVITVGASDHLNRKTSWSNFGSKIDVVAPGNDVLSLKSRSNTICTIANNNIVGGDYCRLSGTSMSTPHVAGLAALILSYKPDLTNEEVRQYLRTFATDLGTSGKDNDYGFGLIDAGNTFLGSTNTVLTPHISYPSTGDSAYGSNFQIRGSIGGENFESYTVEVGVGRNPSSWETIKQSNIRPQIDGVIASLDTTRYNLSEITIKLTAYDTLGETYEYQIYDVYVDERARVNTVVSDSITGNGIYDVKVIVRTPGVKGKSGTVGTYTTNQYGYFQTLLPRGTYEFSYSARGYSGKIQTVTVTQGEKYYNEVTLTPKTR